MRGETRYFGEDPSRGFYLVRVTRSRRLGYERFPRLETKAPPIEGQEASEAKAQDTSDCKVWPSVVWGVACRACFVLCCRCGATYEVRVYLVQRWSV